MLNHSNMSYGGPVREIAPSETQEQSIHILAFKEVRYGSEAYPEITFYKLVQVEAQYIFYTYVDSTNGQMWAEREDSLPAHYSREQALSLWENLTEYMKDGAEIGRGPVFWKVTLSSNGTIVTSPVEDWKATPRSYYLG